MKVIELFNLFGTVTLDDQTSGSLDKVDSKAQGTGSTLKSMTGTVAKWGAAFVSAAGVAGGALAGMMTKYGNFADELLDTAEITGMTTDELQKWRDIAIDAGVDTDIVAGSFERLNKQLERGNDLSPRLQEAFDTMNMGVEEFQELHPDQQMREVVETMMELEDADARAFANQMNMPDMLPLVAEMEEKGEDVDKIMEEIDVPFDNEDLEQMDDYRQAWDNFKETIFEVLGEALMPLFEWFSENSEEIEDFIDDVINRMSEAVENLIDWFKEYKDVILPIVKTVMGVVVASWVTMATQAAIAAVKKSIAIAKIIAGWVLMAAKSTIAAVKIAAAWVIAMGPIGWAITVIAGLVAAVIMYWDEIIEATEWLSEKLSEIFEAIKEFIFEIWENIKEKTAEIWGWINEHIIDRARNIYEQTSGWFSNLWGTIKEIWDGILDTIKGAVNNIIDAIESMINWSIDNINTFINAVNSAIDTINNIPGVNIGTVPTMDAVSIPQLAEGGTITRSGSALVGEEGPEMLDLPQGAQVRPLDETDSKGDSVVFERGAFEGVMIMDDYSVDRFMERVVERLKDKGGL